jgi:hypothetical protein
MLQQEVGIAFFSNTLLAPFYFTTVSVVVWKGGIWDDFSLRFRTEFRSTSSNAGHPLPMLLF